MRAAGLLCSAMISLGLSACVPGAPARPTAEPSIPLYVVTNGPHPLYETYGEWLAARVPGTPAAQAESLTISAGRIARVQHNFDPGDTAWMLTGCIFDVQSTSPDQLDATYQWAFGRIVRCDEPVADGIVEPQMGVRPHKSWIYDGRVGYFPRDLLEPSTDGR